MHVPVYILLYTNSNYHEHNAIAIMLNMFSIIWVSLIAGSLQTYDTAWFTETRVYLGWTSCGSNDLFWWCIVRYGGATLIAGSRRTWYSMVFRNTCLFGMDCGSTNDLFCCIVRYGGATQIVTTGQVGRSHHEGPRQTPWVTLLPGTYM